MTKITSPKKTYLDAELSYLVKSTVKDAIALDTMVAKQLIPKSQKYSKPGDTVTVKLIYKTKNREVLDKWVREHEGKILSTAEGGNVFLANLPTKSLHELDKTAFVQRAEASRILLPRLDKAVIVTGLEKTRQKHNLTGKDVVFGIVDTGLDWRHRDFRTSNGKTRIEQFTYAHLAQNSDVSKFNDFDTNDINAAIKGTKKIPDGDPDGHGTHCASIAVGNGKKSNGRFVGVAPNAAIIAMRSEPLSDTHTIRGIRDIFQCAGNRPAVVSLSLGYHLGPHDGTSAIENVITQESGPGRIVVVAAGNEGGDGIHWQGQLIENQSLTITTRIADPNLQFVDVWIPRGDDVEIKIQSHDGNQYDPDGSIQETVFGNFRADWRIDPINQDQNLTLRVQGKVNFHWKIIINAKSVLHGEVHAWGHTESPSNASNLFPGFVQPGFSIGMPGTEERAIVVGSYVSKTGWENSAGDTIPMPGLQLGQLSDFSSHGPTRIGKQKPDIAAPGQYITAALAEDSKLETDPHYIPRHHKMKGYVTIQGTSMATPFVAGVIALMLEREPTLTPEEIQQRFRITATRDEKTGRVWDTGFGYGKLNVDALLNYNG